MAGREDLLLESAAKYHFFGKTYGYTKDETDALPAWLAARMPVVAEIEAEIQAEQQARREES